MESQPVSEAWEAPVLPLNYARSLFLIDLRIPCESKYQQLSITPDVMQ
jgi:hypothetical protein